MLAAIFLASLWQLNRSEDTLAYLRKMRIQGPLIFMFMFVPIFTGMVMMAGWIPGMEIHMLWRSGTPVVVAVVNANPPVLIFRVPFQLKTEGGRLPNGE